MASVHTLAVLPVAKVVSVSKGQVTPVASGAVSLMVTDGAAESLVFIMVDGWSYPLVDQVIMKSSDRVYILPAGSDGTVNFVLSLGGTDDIGAFERQVSRFASLRTRDGAVITPAPGHHHGEHVEELVDDGAGHHATAAAAAVGGAGAQPAPPAGTSTQLVVNPQQHPSSMLENAVGAAVTVGSAAASAAVYAAPHVLAAASSAATAAYGALPQNVKDVKAADVGNGLSRGLLMAGSYTKHALISSAGVAGTGLRSATSVLADKLGRTEPVHVTPEAQARAEQAKMLSKAAVTVSGSLVLGAATIAKTLGSSAGGAFMATEYGKKLAGAGQTEAGKAVRQVAASGIVAAAEVWGGLETAATIFTSHAGDATTDFVHRRYGAEAGALAATSVEAAKDVGKAMVQVGTLGATAMIGRTAAEAAREVVVQTTPGGPSADSTGNTASIVRSSPLGGMPSSAMLATMGPMGLAFAAQQHAAASGQTAGGLLGMAPVGAGDAALLQAAIGTSGR